MNLRSIFLVGALALGPGCARDLEPFLGTYTATGAVTFSFAGQNNTQPRSDTVRVTEGDTADILLTSEGGCALPAEVEDALATLVPNTSCTENVTLPDGTVLAATLVVTSGTATLVDEVITLNYAGTVSVVYEGMPYTAGFSSAMTLSRATTARAIAGPDALRAR
ncbi:hypothetical protein D187_005142 [Cystobacter fuscus DSM 2262]|uniref:Uncharacterized protein n=1 Tax=Cystobacter fuscus (strain ATCC 25194 / DSM 2262 / NBRC 100088 / M29) TaxID=1242864 RepID=S9QRV1_CYSF2|nr:hypothetical protein [Cystobacter fuscus]EPX64009.1 hypothetical protein D187_005142 [Cystobacter fuscus DSM 2262]